MTDVDPKTKKTEKNEIVKNTTSSAFSAAQAKWYQL